MLKVQTNHNIIFCLLQIKWANGKRLDGISLLVLYLVLGESLGDCFVRSVFLIKKPRRGRRGVSEKLLDES